MSLHTYSRLASTVALTFVVGGPAQAFSQSTVERGHVRRLVSLVPSATDVILALGATDRLVARTDFDTDPRIHALPSIGGPARPGIEAMVALRPDVVLLWRVGPGSHLGPWLEEFGIRTVSLGTETLHELYETIDTIGVLLDRQSRADSLRRAIVDTLDAVRRSNRQPPVRVFYAAWHEPPMTAGPGTFIDELIRAAGGINIYDDAPTRWPVVSLEVVVQRDPDVIVVPADGAGQLSAAALCRSGVWRQIRAVRDVRIVEVEERLFNRPGPFVGHAARQLSMRLDSMRRAQRDSAPRCAS